MLVRDVLFVDDLVRAFLLARDHMRSLSGRAFNIGGGPGNILSFLELLKLIARLNGSMPRCEISEWRPRDQRYSVSDTRKLQSDTGSRAKIDPVEGVEKLYDWLRRARGLEPVIRPALHRRITPANGHALQERG